MRIYRPSGTLARDFGSPLPLSVAASDPAPFGAGGRPVCARGNSERGSVAPLTSLPCQWRLCVVWHDNLTDEGMVSGISARRLSGQLSGLSSLRVNQDGAGDPGESPGGHPAHRWREFDYLAKRRAGIPKIQARVLKSDGQFAGPVFDLRWDTR